MKNKYSLFLYRVLLFQILLTCQLFGQNEGELKNKKLENIKKLNYSRELLEKTEKSKNATLNQLNLIQRNIEYRSSLVENLSDELDYLKNDIEGNIIEIKKIEEEIKRIKNDYSELIRAASRNLDNDYALMYIYSSDDFNMAYQRIKYLKYIAKYREDLVSNLKDQQEYLLKKNSEMIVNKEKNESLLNAKKRELIDLDSDKRKSLSLVRSLQNKESELKKEVQTRERIQKEIEMQIRKIIEEEAAKARLTNRPNILTPEEKLISSDFVRNMGRLPWPSEQGIITGKYGEQNHAVLKGIKINSNGIDINTVAGAKVRSVFDGEVTKVIAILGANYTVIIKHGEFRTVYQNLINVQVKAGDKIKTKAIIGTVFTDQDNASRFHFEVWKDKLTQNPELWLSK